MNAVFVTGLHYPQLVDRTSTAQGLRYQDDSPRNAGDLVLAVVSGTGAPTTWALDNMASRST